MNRAVTDSGFVGSIPQLYEQHMVPLMFETYAVDLAERVAQLNPSRVLEVAAGTGVVTRQLARRLPGRVAIVATDLNQPMLDHAESIGTARPVVWREANAMQLPFPDGAFDVVACQFGVMFFPDRVHAYSEIRRVLQPGGSFVFNVWDRIEDNEFTHTASLALRELFANDPPRFMERLPHGYFDVEVIARDLAAAGFDAKPDFVVRTARSSARSPSHPAVAICQGTPLRTEIEARGRHRLDEATRVVADAIGRRFGPTHVDGKVQAIICSVRR